MNAPELPQQAAARRAVEILGGLASAARALNVKDGRYQTIQSWLRNRVPAEYCPAIEKATEGKVRCEDLRPDVAWEVLREQIAKPAIPKPAAEAKAGA